MKKFLLFFILLIFLPLKVYAINIVSATIEGPSEGIIGDFIPLKIKIKFSDLDKNDINTKGIHSIVLAIGDEDDLLYFPENGSITSNMNTAALTESIEEGLYTVIESIYKDDMPNNTCLDGVLFCGDYETTINFAVKDTDKTELKVGFILISVTTHPVNLEYWDESKLDTKLFTSPNIYTIKLKKEENKTPSTAAPNIPNSSNSSQKVEDIIENATKDIVVETKEEKKTSPSAPKNSTNSQSPATTTTPKKSKNTKLSKLEVKDYDIGFSEDKDYYELYVEDENLNSLEITVELSDSKSTFEIKGADDLKKNNNRITIDVTAENGDKKTYTINVKTKHEYKEKEKEETVKIFKYEVKKRYVKYAIVVFIAIVILIILKIIFSIAKERLGHRKYYKAVKKLNK